MAHALTNLLRLARAGLVLSEHGVRFVPKGTPVPWPLKLASTATWPVRLVRAPFRLGANRRDKDTRISSALTRLGPSYIKLGQFLATRQDLIDADLARDLGVLRDRLPPFSMAEARASVTEALGAPVDALFESFGPPVAAASIAQVHKAIVNEGGVKREVAVKILRPGVEKRFQRDLESFSYAAAQIERFAPAMRRLKPTAVVDTLARSVELEMDLRLEAAAISEMTDNIVGDTGFRVPTVDWKRTAKRVLTMEWIDGTPMSDVAALKAAGFDLKELGNQALQSFLRHAMRDGFFHADMHQGNLFVDKVGTIVAVDFGIMGRLGSRERRFLAEILNGFINRDYLRAAHVHFWAGYVPPHHPVETFAQALRAVGEPIQGRPAEEISMAQLLGQLFAYTEVFDMETRPELILLQKTMVAVEGVARSLDPGLNMWTAAEPIVRDWMARELGVQGMLREAGEGAQTVGKLLAEVPGLLSAAESTVRSLSTMAARGVRLDDETVAKMVAGQARASRGGRLALWVIALALVWIVAWLWG